MDSGTSLSPVVETSLETVSVKRQSELPLGAISWFLALLVLLFLPVLKPLVSEWLNNENMGHALFVPFVAGYIVWLDRERIMAAPVKPFWPAILLVLWGFCQMIFGFLGATSFIAETAFLVSLVGVIWTIAGTAVLRTVLFPLGVLLFMIRIPLFVWQQLTFPLQLFASDVASRALELIGIPVFRTGNVLSLPAKDLQVVEACSGIRSLLSLTFLSVAYGRLFETRVWMKIVLFVSTIPIAIACNAFRVTLTGVLTQYNPTLADGVYHSLEGWVIFVVEMVVFLAFHRLLCRFAKKSHA